MADKMDITAPQSVFEIANADVGPVASVASLVPAGSTQCIVGFNAGFNLWGLRNNCSECKLAVISWPGLSISRYKVPGRSQIVITCPVSGGQLIGEDPC